MKKKDIEVDGVYAVAEQHQWMPSHYDVRRGRVAAKAKVLEVGVPRRGSATQDGVKIQLLERMSGVYGRHVGDTIVVSSREVRELWSEFAPRRKRWEDEQIRAQESAERAAQALTKRITDALPEGFDVSDVVPRLNRIGTFNTSMQMQYTRLANLLEAAAQNAKENSHG